MKRTRPARPFVPVLVALALVTGCSGEAAPLSESASQALTDQVVEVAHAAGSGDLDAAAANLDALQQRLDVAVADEEVSADRAARIQLSIDAVRGDLESLAAAAAAATPTEPAPVPTQEPAEAPSEVATPEVTTPEVVTPEAVTPAPPGPGVGPSEKGKAKGKDNGKGKR